MIFVSESFLEYKGIHGVLPQENGGGAVCGVMEGPVKLGFEWGTSQHEGGLWESSYMGGTPLLSLKKEKIMSKNKWTKIPILLCKKLSNWRYII